jgi:hypothetical protein
MGSFLGSGNSESKTKYSHDQSDRRVAATENANALATQGKNNISQTGGVIVGKKGTLNAGGFNVKKIGKNSTITITNEAPESVTTATGLLEAYVKGQANGGLGSVIADSPSPSPGPSSYDPKTLVALTLSAVALLTVLMKR